MSLQKKLARYKKHLQRPGQEKPKESPPKTNFSAEPDEAIKKAAAGLNAQFVNVDEQYVLVKETDVLLTELHGRQPLSDIYPVMEAWQDYPDHHPLSSKGKEAGDLLFFDTETTGLGAGAGHMIFLLGAGFIKGDTLKIKQYFLPGPGHEVAFYHTFLNDIGSLNNLVTFNGKAFDWPRVKTRHQFVRNEVPKLPSFGHFDLLHASRRLWKHELEHVRLQHVEAKKIDYHRVGDVPGHMAPFLYFQFLKAPKASLVEGVLQHNLEDIKSLVSLYIQLSQTIVSPHLTTNDQSKYAIAKWHADLGNISAGVNLLEDTSTDHFPARKLLAFLYKKQGNTDDAYHLFENLVAQGPPLEIECCIEAAKLSEHYYRDLKTAYYFTELAQQRLSQKQRTIKQPYKKEDAALQKRMSRLLRKIEVFPG